METGTERIRRWALYAGATLLLCLLQTMLHGLRIWGLFPFLYPLMVAAVANYEGAIAGTAYGLTLGILCDLTLAAPIPCFYTLIFPPVGLVAGLIAGGLLSSGPFCLTISAVVSLTMTDLFHGLLLWMTGKAAWQATGVVFLRELILTLPFLLPVGLLFHRVHQKTLTN